MSQYIKSPFRPPTPLLVANSPQYVFGSWLSTTGPTLGNVLSDSAITTTATVKIQILSGNIPVAGAKITVVGAANSPNFNVTNATIISVSAPAAVDVGVYSVTYAITSTSQGTLLDAGQFCIPQPELGEDITGMGSIYTSVGVAAPFNNPQMDQGKALSVTVSFPALNAGSAATVSLQGADFDVDSEYQDIAVVATVTAGSIGSTGHFNSGQGTSGTPGEVNLLNYRFYRLNITSASTLGTAGQTTIVGKIEC
jgi:hypothetical protein